MSKFTVAGVSRTRKNIYKVRFCSDRILRIKNLNKQGDDNINLVDLPHSMDKAQACRYLLSLDEFRVFESEIIAVLGKKELPVTQKQPKIEPIKSVELDDDLEEIKQLAVA